jgi:NAD-dependent SIR2 family protein deacetylase
MDSKTDMTQQEKDKKEILEARKELAGVVQAGWECRHCGDFFRRPDFKFDHDYNQMSPKCPCCGEWL